MCGLQTSAAYMWIELRFKKKLGGAAYTGALNRPKTKVTAATDLHSVTQLTAVTQ